MAQLQELGWGRMAVDRRLTPYPGELWGVDNGAFIAWRSGKPWDEACFLRRVAEALASETAPYLCVTPDRVACPSSLEFSLDWRAQLPDALPWYLAVQNGMTLAAVAAVLPRFAGLFLGGTDQFKSTAREWCALAHAAGKRFHYARAGTLSKLEHAIEVGSDSCDSSFPLWTKVRLRQFAYSWEHRPQRGLFATGHLREPFRETKSSLLIGQDGPLEGPATVVPGRNRVLILAAAQFAQQIGGDEVVFSAHRGDAALYEDCRPEFVEALRSELPLPLLAPFLDIDKPDVVAIGSVLGVPWELTWSCYCPTRGLQCGACGACRERQRAFREAGAVDPTEYAEIGIPVERVG